MSVKGQFQLKSVVLRYCKTGGSSRGMREFLANELVSWATQHPQVAVRVEQVARRHPVVFGEYVDGTTKQVGVKNDDLKRVASVLEQLRNIRTAVVRDLSRPVISSHPSIQGPWDPSTSFDSFTLRIAQPKQQGREQLK